MQIGPFHIDEADSNDEYLFVDVAGLGSVTIKRQENGIVVDVFGLEIRDEAVASTWAAASELLPAEDQDDD